MNTMLLLATLFLQMLAPPQSFAVIREIRSLAEIEPHLSADTLLVLDLDNTLMAPRQMLGSHQWFEHVIKKKVKSGKAPELALKESVTLWNKIHERAEMRPVEPTTSATFTKWKRNNVKVIGLTARGPELSNATLRQLNPVGVEFSPAPGLSTGILFAGFSADKGKTLVEFLKKHRYHPTKIVFVDDRLSNCQSVEKALLPEGIEHHEMRYGALDNEVSAFNAAVAEAQLKHFEKTGELLSDAKAKRQLPR